MSNDVSDLTVPPEEDRHERTFMQWPVDTNIHPDRAFLDILQQTIADIANSIVEFEPLTILAASEDQRRARRLLSDAVEIWDIPTEDLWCRDSGPLFAKTPDGQTVMSHLQFNGWGGKQIHRRDGRVAVQIAKRLGLPIISSGLTGEAGGVEHDGHGLLMAHESSWVNKNRNPGLSRIEIENRLLAAYGAKRILWSPGVWGQDITDYHIDSLARFTGPGRVLINLLTNAFYAVHKRAGDSDHAPAVTVRTRQLGENVTIEIEDNGTGISEEVQRRIFEPFFTTKPTGEGTGLGLSLAHDIIAGVHGGELEVESELGAGTTFRITIPAVAEIASPLDGTAHET